MDERAFWSEVRRGLMIVLKAINVKYGFQDTLNPKS